eukprot:PITA_09255
MDEHEAGLMGLGNLPESCMSIILGLTTPRDVCRFSAVSNTFRLAGYSDSVWEKMLPIQYRHLLSRLDSPLQFSSKKELYFTLCHPQLIDCSKKKFWIERATGKLCFIMSPRELHITRGNEVGNCLCKSRDDSSFKEAVELNDVCWFEVRGLFDCKVLSLGTEYTISFRLKLNEGRYAIGLPYGFRVEFPNSTPNLTRPLAYGWYNKPVKFSVTTADGDYQIYALFLSDIDKPVADDGYQMATSRHVEEGWMEIDAGRFFVDEEGDNPGKIDFCMGDWEGRIWKGGLLLDGVKIQPTSSCKK